MFRSTAIAGLIAVGLSSGPAFAKDKPLPYKVDLAHTQILFSVNHMGTSITHGRFDKFTIDLKFDPAKPEKTSANVVIDTSSVDTGFDKRDEHLRTPDFFNVAKFANMTFKSTKVDVTGPDTAKLTGDLTMIGVTKPVTLDVKVEGQGPSPFTPGVNVYGFTITGSLNRSDWGMTKFLPAAGSKAGVGDEISIWIGSEVNNAPLPKPTPPAPPPPPKAN
jgi:polyisoprenoid-binding protein YceI